MGQIHHFEVPQHQPGWVAAITLVCFKGMVPGSILGLSSSYLCTFLRYRLPLVHLDWFRMDSLSKTPWRPHDNSCDAVKELVTRLGLELKASSIQPLTFRAAHPQVHYLPPSSALRQRTYDTAPRCETKKHWNRKQKEKTIRNKAKEIMKRGSECCTGFLLAILCLQDWPA